MEREIIGNIGGLYMCGYVSIYYKNNNRKFDIKKLAVLKEKKTIAMAKVDELNGGDATKLFLE